MKTKKITYMGLMLGVVIVLSFLEHSLPPVPMLPPGVRLGLSNIVTMYCLFFLGRREALGIGGLKSAFVFLIRGPVAGLLSLCGGLLSLCVVILALLLFKERLSYLVAGICGAVMHNIGQIMAASILMGTGFVLYYLPVLILSGLVLGSVTGIMLKALLPVFHRIFGEV